MASCENKYTTLLDLSRQAKVISGETACFNGKIEVGIPFSGYPTGVDTGSTVSLGVVSSETAVFSGNTGTTIFDVSNSGSTNYDVIFSGYSGTVWTNALFSGNTSGLTLPITTLSASTQIVGPFWTLTQTGMTGDYVIGTEYTGYSLTYSFNQVEQLSVTAYTAYSGFSSASQENFSAGTLDYKGPLDYLSSVEDVTVDGRLTTNKITITNGASASTIGFVLTQLDETGKAGWVYNSSTASTNTFVSGGTLDGSYLNLSYNTGGSVPSIQLSGLTGGGTFTGNTSGDCITDIHVSKIHSCSPLNINPLDEGNVYFGSTSGVTIDIINSRIGIGRTPDYPLDMTIGSSRLFTSSEVSGNAVRFSGNTTGLTQFLIYDSDGAGISFGQRNSSDSFYTGYGEQGDGFIYSGIDSNGLNLISQPGTGTDDYIRFFAGQGAGGTPDLFIQGTGATKGYIAVGHSAPTEKLHIDDGDILIENGNGKLWSDLLYVDGPVFRLSGGTGDLSTLGVKTPASGGISVGSRGSSAGLPEFGKQGDGFLYSSEDQNGLNIISQYSPSGTEDYIRFYAGKDAKTTADMIILGTVVNSGYIGMGTETPTEKLHVLGNIKMVDGNQSNGYVLTSDSNGVGSWGYNTLTNRRVVYATASFDPSIVDYDIVIYSGGSGGGTIYLATGNVAGNEIILIRKGDTVAADLGAGGGGLINGSGTKALPTALYSTVRCIFDGTNWSCTNETLL